LFKFGTLGSTRMMQKYVQGVASKGCWVQQTTHMHRCCTNNPSKQAARGPAQPDSCCTTAWVQVVFGWKQGSSASNSGSFNTIARALRIQCIGC
jgi:Tfp pilus assembly protein PilV